MPLITAAEVVQYSNITASAATITASGLIPQVQARITIITNNWFTTDLYLQTSLTFNGTARTIVAGANNWAEWGFADGDEIYVYQSYKNDGYYEVSTVSEKTLTLAAGSVVVDELSGRSILTSVVQWPGDLKYPAAQMVAWDYDSRKDRVPGVRSRSLGPWSESYSSERTASYGYPKDIVDMLDGYKVMRLM